MSRLVGAALAAIVAAGAAGAAGTANAAEKVGVIAVGDPPYGPDADLTELAHQLRAACRDRVGGVEEVPTMRARLLGQASNATLSELDRAYGGALAVYQNGEFESALRTLRAIIEDLDNLPEGEEAYEQWKRALLRLVHVAQTIGDEREVDRTLVRLAMTDPSLQPDPEQYSPTYRRRFEAAKGKVRAFSKRRLQILSEGRPGVAFVNGRAMGVTPITLTLPAGTYRIGGAAGTLRVPSFTVDLEAEDRMVVLDFALAEALRVNAGPGLALPAPQRAYGIIRAGAWLGVDKLVVASRASEGGADFLLGSIYDVRRGALLREGSVRMVAGGVPSVNLGALASFLLTGQSSRDVKDRTREAKPVIPPAVAAVGDLAHDEPVPPPPPRDAGAAVAAAKQTAEVNDAGSRSRTAAVVERAAAAQGASTKGADVERVPAKASASGPSAALPPALAPAPPPSASVAQGVALGGTGLGVAAPGVPRWIRPAAIGSGAAAALFAAIAVQQTFAASAANRDADALLGPDGTFQRTGDIDRYAALRRDADASTRNSDVSAGVAVGFAAAAGVLGWKGWHASPDGGVGVRF